MSTNNPSKNGPSSNETSQASAGKTGKRGRRTLRGLRGALFSSVLFVGLARSSHAQTYTPTDTAREVQLRSALLRNSFESVSVPLRRYAPALLGSAFLVGAAGFAFDPPPTGKFEEKRWHLTAGLGTFAALSFGTYALPTRYQGTTFALLAGAGLAGAGAVGWAWSEQDTRSARVVFGSMLGAGILTLGLEALDTALLTPLDQSEIEGHLRRLGRRGAAPSRAELRRMEWELSLTRRRIPAWLVPLTVTLSGVVAASPLLAFPDASKSDRVLSALVSIQLLQIGNAGLISARSRDTGYPAYVRALRNVRLAPLAGGGANVSVSSTW
ncbi:MAG TPA: hypothetical protein VFQ61_26705 [Polyangiaceae bacterium]|nr:hypothetical protein [Polyangiaceae bacterium]